MIVSAYMTPRPLTVSGTCSADVAAGLMRRHQVFQLPVLDDAGSLVGIVTDRDIAISIVALGLDPDVLTVGDIVGPDLVTMRENQGVFETIQQMRFRGVRCLPIVGEDGALVGIVAVDDLVALFADELSELSKVITREQVVELKTRKSK